MAGPVLPQRLYLRLESCPFLRRHVMPRHDPTGQRWVILVPEGVLVPKATAVAVLQLADGTRSLTKIAQSYAADPELIAADALEMLQDLVDRGFLKVKAEV